MSKGHCQRFAIRAAAACVLCLLPASAEDSKGRVNDIRFWSNDGATRIAIEVTSEYRLRSDRLYNPDRVFFDIVGVKPAGRALQTIHVGDGFVKQIRVAETQPGTTRVVLDLASSVEFTVSQLSSPERLIVELRPLGTARQTTSPLTPSAYESARAPARVVAKTFRPPELPRPDFTPIRIESEPPRFWPRMATASIPLAKKPPAPAPPQFPEIRRESFIETARPGTETARPGIETARPGTETVRPRSEAGRPGAEAARVISPRETLRETPAENMARATSPRMPAATPASPAKTTATGEASLTRVLGLKLGRVVIDAGHGGHDVGTQGPTGLLEKEVVLDIAKRLATLVESRLNSEVVLTRADDRFVPLEMRPRIANDHKADLFISIHANSSPARATSGAETYFLNFTSSKFSLEVAARENAASEHSIHDLKDLLQKIAMKDKMDESREFAAKIQSSMAALASKTNTGAKDRGVKKAPFIVLIGASMPAILAEIGFISNGRDEALMKRPDHRQKIAEALFRGISQYAAGLSHFQVARTKLGDQ